MGFALQRRANNDHDAGVCMRWMEHENYRVKRNLSERMRLRYQLARRELSHNRAFLVLRHGPATVKLRFKNDLHQHVVTSPEWGCTAWTSGSGTMEAVCAPSPSTEHASCFEDWLLWVLEECADNDHTLGWCVQCWPPSPPAWLGAGGPIYLWPFWWLASHVGNGVPPCLVQGLVVVYGV